MQTIIIVGIIIAIIIVVIGILAITLPSASPSASASAPAKTSPILQVAPQQIQQPPAPPVQAQAPPSPPPAVNNYVNKALKAEAGGRCVDVPGGSKDNVFLQMYDCNGTPAQQWSYDGAHHIVNTGSNRCLDANMSSGRVQQWGCEGPENKTQRWTLVGNQIQLEQDPSKCLNINGGVGNQGDGLIIYPCSENGANEHFNFV